MGKGTRCALLALALALFFTYLFIKGADLCLEVRFIFSLFFFWQVLRGPITILLSIEAASFNWRILSVLSLLIFRGSFIFLASFATLASFGPMTGVRPRSFPSSVGLSIVRRVAHVGHVGGERIVLDWLGALAPFG
jgi:hypothetical protein